MSSILKNAAAASVSRGQPSSYYMKDSRQNPVLQALDQELKLFVGYMKKRASAGYIKPEDESHSRPSDTLFELWNKYEARLPALYYQEKLLEIGDFLVTIKEYKLALWQCYERYLQTFGDVNVEEITDVDTFRKTFFPSGFKAENAGLTFRAVMGKSISMYQVVKLSDPKLQNKQSIERCVQILTFLRLVTQVVLPKESLCWLVYNGTVHIYSMARHLMSLGHSARVLEYLLWASMCMETSVPLLAVKYLTWRSTLYTAVCQCYFDCKATEQAEKFARRGLAKISELSQLESLSSHKDCAANEISFRTATIKMAVMVFKRSVFETRREPKGILRPKTRANLKDALDLPWPRTPTEKMLADMFDGSSAQFLGILESLSNSNRRILQTSPPATDHEPEILDVYLELMLAAQEILAGGAGNRQQGSRAAMATVGSNPLAVVARGGSLMDMATRGEDIVPLEFVIRLVKLAYNFEHWDTMDVLMEPTLRDIKESGDPRYAWDAKALELLAAVGKMNSSRRRGKAAQAHEEAERLEEVERLARAEHGATKDLPPPKGGKKGSKKEISHSAVAESAKVQSSSVKSASTGDDLVHLADVIMSIVTGPYQKELVEVDMVVDATMLVWQRCKLVFQKYQTGSVDNPRFLQRMDNPNKVQEADEDDLFILHEPYDVPVEPFTDRTSYSGWMYLLDTVHQGLGWCGLSSVDPGLTAEVVLRLAMVYESSAQLDGMDDVKSAMKESKTTLTDAGTPGDVNMSRTSQLSLGDKSSVRQALIQARDILEHGLQNVSFARKAVALNDGKNIADVTWVKDFHPDIFQASTTKDVGGAGDGGAGGGGGAGGAGGEDGQMNPEALLPESLRGSATAVWNTVKDLHLELTLMYHRVTLKLAAIGAEPPRPTKGGRRPYNKPPPALEAAGAVENFDQLVQRCNKNFLSKALLYTQRAVMIGAEGGPSQEQAGLFEEAVTYIQRVQVEERKTYMENSGVDDAFVARCKVPPPPTLLCRTDTFVVFKPAPFEPTSLEKVAWYRIFARSASGANVKARLSDYYFPGTGEEVPSYRCELKVSGLSPNEKYVFAVAAYTAEGALIGGGVGDTTKPILAAHPMPLLMTWATISQMAYQTGCYSVASQACRVLWDHFVVVPQAPESPTYISEAKRDFKLTLLRLNQRAVCLSSPVLLRQFLTSIFINIDISAREGQLFCDIVCDKGALYDRQIERLRQCEKTLVAVELAGWLNEANLALQAVVQIYGLLAPMLYYKIPSLAVIQILQRCHAVLQEIPVGLIQKRQGLIADSLNHMVACITYHMAKTLRTWGQKSLANNIIEAGKKLLTSEADVKTTETNVEEEAASTVAGSVAGKTAKATKKTSVTHQPRKSKEDGEGPHNEELRALEAHMLSVTKAATADHELSGSEDPNVLHAYIAYLPSFVAFKEVVKFKRGNRFLEFLVHVAQKGLTEGQAELVVGWCEDGCQWLGRRNEGLIGARAFLNKQQGAVTVSGDDPRKFAAAMVEYRGEKESTPRGAAGKAVSKVPSKTKNKKGKYKPLRVTESMSSTAKIAQEEKELKALDVMGLHLVDMYHMRNRRGRMRRITVDEMPWRSQLNIIYGLSHFSTFLQKLEKREKMLGSTGMSVNRTNFLDQEWFTLETAGVMIVGWEGGPVKNAPPGGPPTPYAFHSEFDMERRDSRPRTTAIEIAAAAATGAPPPPLFAPAPVVEDTPGTYRSDSSKKTDGAGSNSKIDEESSPLTTSHTVNALDKTFNYFKRAVILAHRGQHWTLLQNAGRALWNCAHTALLRAFTPDQTGSDPGLLTLDMLRSLLWQPFYLATDCLLDMMVVLQDALEKQATRGAPQAKSRGKNLGNYFESWVGGIQAEKGGASLKFEGPLDDTNQVDMRWLRRFVLRTMEMLYLESKWEKLVDVALRFSALTNNRYAEQVIPLLVQAQGQIQRRIHKAGGPAPPQPHYMQLEKQLGHVTTARDYLRQQLQVHLDSADGSLIQPGAQIDPMGHEVYSETDAFRLSGVPLDQRESLAALRETMEFASYTSRALHHSRKLLCLYLASQQNVSESNAGREPTHVDFALGSSAPQPTMPPSKANWDYSTVDEVQVAPVPQSQMGIVITSYEKTIDILYAKNQKGLSAQAMHELGNIFFHAKNVRAAFKWWSQALDIVLNMNDAIHNWREVTKGAKDVSVALLDRCGLWGCVLAGVLASNIAQYVLTCDIRLKIESCFLAGYLFKALFRSSLPHPTSDRDYALYSVGEGCEVTNLVPGVDFLSDRFRCDGRQLVAALRWVTEELSRGQHNIFVLPLLTLNQYFSTFVCRDVQRAVDGRILTVRILTDLGLYSEAMIVLNRLLNGERLPHIGDSNFRQMEGRSSPKKFSTEKPMMDPQNLKEPGAKVIKQPFEQQRDTFDNRRAIWNMSNFLVLEHLLDKRLSSSLGTLFGPHMTCHLTLVQAHLFVCLANTIPVLPKIEEQLSSDPGQPGVQGTTVSRGGQGKGPLTAKNSKLSNNTGSEEANKYKESEANLSAAAPARFSDGTRTLSLEEIKGQLLSVADKMVTCMGDVIVENATQDKIGVEGLAAAELELVVWCRMEQARIAQQKQHAPLAARTVLNALKLIQGARVFKQPRPPTQAPRPSSIKGTGHRKPIIDVRLAEPEHAQFQYQNFQARSRLDARLWLQCRLELVNSLMMEIRGMGQVKGQEGKVVTELADCRQYCAEGLGEAEACGDTEMQATFFVLGAQLNVIEGKSLEHTVSLIDDAMVLLRNISCRSVLGEQLLADALIFKADLEAAAAKSDIHTDNVTHKSLAIYLQAQRIILDQMELLGEKIEHYHSDGSLDHLSSPVAPMQNVYLPHVQRLAQMKLRIGHAMARITAKKIRNGRSDVDPVLGWVDCLGVLTTALEVSQVSAAREAAVEAEILLLMGKVQKMLVYQGKYQARSAAGTLLEAIKISYINDHDLGLMRQAYIEIALIYLYSVGLIKVQDGSFLESVAGDSDGEQSITSGRQSSSLTERKLKRKDDNANENAATPSKKDKPDKASKADKEKLDSAEIDSTLKRGQSKVERELTEEEKEKRCAWIAVRCATACAVAQRSRGLLSGDAAVTSQKVGEKSSGDVPDFLALDLLSGYVLGEKKKVYKNEPPSTKKGPSSKSPGVGKKPPDEIEEELASLIEAQEVKVSETYDDQVHKARTASKELGWIHLLGYQSILQRLVSTATLSVTTRPSEQMDEASDTNDLDLGFISHAQFDTGLNYDVVRYMLHSGMSCLRLTHIHTYLSTNLKVYAADCCAPYPPPGLHMPGQALFPTDLNITIKSYASNLSLNSEMDLDLTDELQASTRAPLPPGSQLDTYKPADKCSTSGADTELAMQWYQPGLEESDPARPEVVAADRRILLLYALSKKTGAKDKDKDMDKLIPGFIWVSLHKVNDLHDRLALLAQRAEVSLVDKGKKEAATPSPSGLVKKKAPRIKALSPKVQRDEQLESLLRQCLDDACSLTGVLPETGGSATDIPFEVTKENIKHLEQLFDPALGMTLRGPLDLLPFLVKLFPWDTWNGDIIRLMGSMLDNYRILNILHLDVMKKLEPQMSE